MNKKHEIFEVLGLVVIMTFMIVVMPLWAGFAKQGFSVPDILTKFMFYVGPGLFFLFAIYVLRMTYLSYPENAYRSVIIHDPENSPSVFSLFGKAPRWVRNPLWLLIFSTLTFSTVAIFAVQENTFFNGIPVLEQQFTPTANIFFAIYPASPAETLGAIFLIGAFLMLLNIFSKGKLSKTSYFVLGLIGASAISGLYGYLNHILRYSTSDIATMNVIYFWTFGGAITVLFGSAILFLNMPDINNLFVKLTELYSSDTVKYTTGGILLVLWILFIFLYITLGKNKKEVKT